MIGYVVDASAMGPLIIPDESGALISDLPQILASDDAIVPQHWRLEVANLARMAVRKKRLTEDGLATAFGALSVLDVKVDSETNDHAWQRSLTLAAQHDLTSYDAAYLELAIRTRRTLVTKDGPLARAASREEVAVLGR